MHRKVREGPSKEVTFELRLNSSGRTSHVKKKWERCSRREEQHIQRPQVKNKLGTLERKKQKTKNKSRLPWLNCSASRNYPVVFRETDR